MTIRKLTRKRHRSEQDMLFWFIQSKFLSITPPDLLMIYNAWVVSPLYKENRYSERARTIARHYIRTGDLSAEQFDCWATHLAASVTDYE